MKEGATVFSNWTALLKTCHYTKCEVLNRGTYNHNQRAGTGFKSLMSRTVCWFSYRPNTQHLPPPTASLIVLVLTLDCLCLYPRPPSGGLVESWSLLSPVLCNYDVKRSSQLLVEDVTQYKYVRGRREKCNT